MFSEIHCIVQGKVQGVGYRDFVDQYARTQGLCGWVRNNPDGSVELALQGFPEDLKACIEILNEGSLLARVDSLSVDWRTPEKLSDGFQVLSS